jgi:hypothetical protein
VAAEHGDDKTGTLYEFMFPKEAMVGATSMESLARSLRSVAWQTTRLPPCSVGAADVAVNDGGFHACGGGVLRAVAKFGSLRQ